MRSPPTPTTRLMKLVFERVLVGREQACWDARGAPHSLTSAPSGGGKTTMSPTLGSGERPPGRVTTTRRPAPPPRSLSPPRRPARPPQEAPGGHPQPAPPPQTPPQP